jgi:hypothetical protein
MIRILAPAEKSTIWSSALGNEVIPGRPSHNVTPRDSQR